MFVEEMKDFSRCVPAPSYINHEMFAGSSMASNPSRMPKYNESYSNRFVFKKGPINLLEEVVAQTMTLGGFIDDGTATSDYSLSSSY